MQILTLGGLAAVQTVSICRKPGVFRSAPEQKVRIGIRLLRESRGLVRLFPFSLRAALSFSGTGRWPRTYPAEQSGGFGGDTEGRTGGYVRHLPAHQRREYFPTFVPEEGPDQTDAADDLFGVDTLTFPVGGPLFSGLRFTGLAAGTLTADLRWQPVSLTNSSSKVRLSFLPLFGTRAYIPPLPPP
jgi:hypothetical protein